MHGTKRQQLVILLDSSGIGHHRQNQRISAYQIWNQVQHMGLAVHRFETNKKNIFDIGSVLLIANGTLVFSPYLLTLSSHEMPYQVSGYSM